MLIAFTGATYSLKAQDLPTHSITLKSVSYSTALDSLSALYNKVIYFSADHFRALRPLSIKFTDATLENALTLILTGTGTGWRQSGEYFLVKEDTAYVPRVYTVSGYVVDDTDKESLIGATIWFDEVKMGTSANTSGFFSISIPEGNYLLRSTFVGYDNYQQFLHLKNDTIIEVGLQPSETVLQEVEVTSEKEEAVENLMKLKSSFKVKSSLVKDAPSFLGESDLVKTLQLLPGIQAGAEGQAGLFVRGGKGDQNLILLDNVPIYNASHVLGLYSVFNPDAVKEIELYKGGIPSRYGGRLSSVVDVQLKDGNRETPVFQGSIGSIASRLSYERPFLKGKGSMMLAARRTYLDLLLRAIPNQPLSANSLYFYDLNLKSTYRLSERDHFSITGFLGRDVTGLPEVLSDQWGNNAISLRWSHLFNQRWYPSLTAFLSHFSARSIVNFVETYGYETHYSIRDIGLKFDHTLYLNGKFTLDAGAEFTYHKYFFGEITPILTDNSAILKRSLDPSFALETGLYVNARHELTNKISLEYGLRYSRFDLIGAGRKYLYDTENVLAPETSDKNITGVVTYGKGQHIDAYHGLEPRISARVLTGRRTAFKFSYNRTLQYTHQLSNTNTPSPSDMWAPVNSYIPPQSAHHFSGGLFRNYPGNVVEFSLEAYYKRMNNQLDFKPLPNLLLNDHLETEVLLGEGVSYGIETMLRKHKGKFTGWISYTLARAERKINGINNGLAYPTSFDRTHNLSVVASFEFNKQVKISANWVYASGVAYTFPSGKYLKDGFIVPLYSNRNGFRLPETHRLDISCTVFRSEQKKNKSSFSFSIYNVYARKNTYAYVFRQNENDRTKTEAVKLYLFTIVPSFSYNFRF